MWQDALARWSQTVYGLVHSVFISNSLGLGNINRIGESITDSFSWLPRMDQFDSNVKHRDSSREDFRLYDHEVNNVILNIRGNLLFFLFVSLAALTDELLSSIMVAKGKRPEEFQYLIDKVKVVRCDNEREWSRKGVIELNIIRNCFIHNDGNWSDRGLNDIRPIVTNLIAKNGDSVDVNYEDLFRYKRAVRTLLNQADTNGFIL